MHNIYPSNILLSKMKVKDNDKCSYCTYTVDVTEQLVCLFVFVCFFECPIVKHLWNFIEGIILRECGINVKLYVIDMVGVQRSNIKHH